MNRPPPPDAAPDAAPGAAPGAAPRTNPAATSQVVSGIAPDAASGAPPGAIRGTAPPDDPPSPDPGVLRRLAAIGAEAGPVVHDARNLLAVVLAIAESALADPAPLPRDELLLLHGAAGRAAALLAGLLCGPSPSPAQPLLLGDSLRAAAPLLRRALGPGVSLSLPAAPGPAVAAPEATLERVWLNLARNAGRALAGRGRLSVTLEHAVRSLAPSVPACAVTWEDDGPGFPAAVLARLGRPLNTAPSDTASPAVPAGAGTPPADPVPSGTGLGLSGSAALLRRLGGLLEAGNRPAGGAWVRVWLPVPASVAPPVAPAPHGVLLLVEDEPALRRLAARVLAAAGWTVLEADSAEAALDLCAAPRLLVTDLTLPGLDGLALAARLRHSHPGLPVLLTSGYDLPADTLPAGVSVLAKPFPLAALAALAAQLA